jgi:predicted transcriptional regulator
MRSSLQITSVVFPRALKAKLDGLSFITGASRSAIIRRALELILARPDAIDPALYGEEAPRPAATPASEAAETKP